MNSIPFIFLLFLSLGLAGASDSPPPSAFLCKSTLYPKLCRSILSSIRFSPSDPYGYGKFSVKKCIKQAIKMSSVIGEYLNRGGDSRLNRQEFGALEDCRELSDSNVEFLQSIDGVLEAAEGVDEELVERIESILSAIVTNGQTCIDGLVESRSSLGNALTAPLLSAGKLYSVSLGLVKNSLSRRWKKRKQKGDGEGGNFPAAAQSREPLNTLIKGLHTMGSCNQSTKCSGRKRLLTDLGTTGILINNTVVVSSTGADNFTSIGDAISFAPNNSMPQDGYFVIYVRQGYYDEYVIVPKYKTNIMLIGDGINRTVITGNHNVVDGWTTYNSSTFTVYGDGFVAIDMTFRNTAGAEKHQAVAVRNSADLSTFYRCSFEGYQDTLYVHSMRQFYRECDVYGTVDFIFGNAAAVFQQCNLYARKPLPNQKNAFTAQGRTDPNQSTGISIHNCTIKAAPEWVMDSNATTTTTMNYLGRPWKPFSRTVYMQSYIGDLISPVGWLEWNGTVGLDTLYYGEFENYGAGANTRSRVNWGGHSLMNITEAMNFTVYNFTMGDTWLPYTDIPFSGGLL
ncbi:probable pectinesterase/pectinesterase inhibitor 25 isoform X3 [Cucurbita pepo subsp. pepo]|uniref:probable pectinesterase/pectinesterase inhibitor 25 isoform X3 n=1 Tax=Cucurbita pepo subsp. pepo TaxID=3664 RepID=UPI000C9D7BEF|nr:probable pectinesterase/pectinesterase inhibitor 25 isoform X3 [Cucurbita pepo subsp. pepo]